MGRNEADLLSCAARQVLAAAHPGQRTVFVDSASTDASAAVAAAAGLEVWPAPRGKGAALAEAVRRLDTEWLICLDADIRQSELNLALELARAVERRPDADMIVGDFSDRTPTVLSNTQGIYEPLIDALFPEAAGRFGSHPLSGFRALRAGFVQPERPTPRGFGIESWLNIEAALSARWHVQDVGWYEGRFSYKPTMGLEIADAILEQALARGRLARHHHQDWRFWVSDVITVIASYRGDAAERDEFTDRLAAVSAIPLPPAR